MLGVPLHSYLRDVKPEKSKWQEAQQSRVLHLGNNYTQSCWGKGESHEQERGLAWDSQRSNPRGQPRGSKRSQPREAGSMEEGGSDEPKEGASPTQRKLQMREPQQWRCCGLNVSPQKLIFEILPPNVIVLGGGVSGK